MITLSDGDKKTKVLSRTIDTCKSLCHMVSRLGVIQLVVYKLCNVM